MCVTPRYIKNPNLEGFDNDRYHGFFRPSYHQRITKDCDSSYIPIPCGTCPECRSRKQTDILQRVQVESMTNYLFMFTLTYNKNVPTYALPNGKVLMTHNLKHLQDMFKRIRKQDYFGRPFKYLASCEYTPKKARPHIHGILFLRKLPTDGRLEFVNLEKLAFDTILKEWRVNVATRVALKDSKKYKKGDIIADTRRPEYVPLLDYKVTYRRGKRHSTYDLHYVTPNDVNGTNDVSFYVSKYLFKEGSGEKFVQSCVYNCGVTKAAASHIYGKIFKSHSVKSLNFGRIYRDETYSKHSAVRPDFDSMTQKKIYSDVNFSRSNGMLPCFFDVYTGKSMPLARYYLRALDWSTRFEVEKEMRKMILEKPKQDIYTRFYKAMNDYKQKSKISVVTDLFDDDEICDLVQDLPDDLPDAALPYGLVDDDDGSNEIAPNLEFDKVLPLHVIARTITPKERQLAFEHFWDS